MTRKERYFTPDTIDGRAAAFLRETNAVRRTGTTLFDPRRSALLVLDLQKYFLDEDSHAFVPGGPAILPRVRDLAEAYAEMGLPLFFTRHGNDVRNAGRMADWWGDMIGVNDPRGEIIEGIGAGKGTVIVKSQYDAFHETGLAEILRQRSVEQVVVCGVVAHLCCESTARSAFVRGFHVFFTVDATADYHEDFHRASLLNLAHGFAVPILAGDLLRAMKNADAR
ncbi:MAG: isochorismatase family protein [Candidatus Eisenbacteria bacterium]|nr:isochorismatase family protein [Candidatus Eisenbacteria bacterium]